MAEPPQPPRAVTGALTRRSLLTRVALAAAGATVAPVAHDLARRPAAAASAAIGATDLVALTAVPSPDDFEYVTPSFTATNGATVLVLVAVADRQSGNVVTVAPQLTIPDTAPTGFTTKIANIEYSGATNDYVQLWAFWATGTGVEGPLQINITDADTNNEVVETIIYHVLELSGNDTATPVAEGRTNSGTGTSAAALLTSPAAGNAEIVFVGADYDRPEISGGSWTTPTSPAGVTELGDVFADDGNGSSNHQTAGTYLSPTAETSITVPSTAGSVNWGSIAIEITCA